MIMDNSLVLSERQAITADAVSTNVIDLGAQGTAPWHAAALRGDKGRGCHIPLLVQVVETFNNLTSLSIVLQTSDDESFATGVIEAARSPVYPLADLAAGKRLLLPDELPVGMNRRYFRLSYDITGTAPTTGRITAAIVAALQRDQGA